MSNRVLKRAWVAVAICFLAATVLSSRAAADCCVCSGCPQGATLCSTVAGCDFDGCASRCEAAGCGTNALDGLCSTVPACPLAAPAGGPAMLLGSALVLMTMAAFALRRRSLPMPIRVASLAAVLIASAAAIHAITQIQVSGQWQADSAGASAVDPQQPQPWTANLALGKDGALSGTVELTGFGDVSTANVEGTLVEGVTSGTLRAADGTAIAHFQVNGDAHAVHGTYTKSQTGETGTFSWSAVS